MRYIRDHTSRFQNRPHYDPSELDRDCETIICGFLSELYGDVCFPVQTDDLTKLIERDAEELDSYADLSSYGEDVEGVTEFVRGARPRVRIAARLTEDSRYENRLRTTLTHEYGHVKFHAALWELEPPSADLLRRNPSSNKIICKRDSIVDSKQTDWMEWQAGYVCGALLMPKSFLVEQCRKFSEERNLFGAVALESEAGPELVSMVMANYRVSEQAAQVRMLKLGLLKLGTHTPSLFD